MLWPRHESPSLPRLLSCLLDQESYSATVRLCRSSFVSPRVQLCSFCQPSCPLSNTARSDSSCLTYSKYLSCLLVLTIAHALQTKLDAQTRARLATTAGISAAAATPPPAPIPPSDILTAGWADGTRPHPPPPRPAPPPPVPSPFSPPPSPSLTGMLTPSPKCGSSVCYSPCRLAGHCCTSMGAGCLSDFSAAQQWH